ncbi:FadR/GntR family transcriptional regulator [Nitratidesulfovibrio sp. D1]|uniref:FadR/GntR family transcriptional regulator n=1 Tax=Nitratidesulfovibrio sp. D1 TaxID=3440151 RepID=UPI003EB936CD
MEKESAILTDLLGRIRCGEWEVGGRLPPERQLAGMLGTSRPTVRGALRVLQARGMVEVRRGSGCYLRSRRERGGYTDAVGPQSGMARLEAAYIILPPLAALCAVTVSPSGLSRLEGTMTSLSRAILGGNPGLAREQTVAFMHALAEATGNPALVATVEQLCPAGASAIDLLFAMEDYERDQFFADLVKVLQALKRHDPEEARLRMEERVLRMCRCMEKYAGTECTPFIRAQLDQRGMDA